MHVLLPRRFHAVGHSKQFLLWICFGILAVVPWQVICGQDDPDRSDSDRIAVDRSVIDQSDTDRNATDPTATDPTATVPTATVPQSESDRPSPEGQVNPQIEQPRASARKPILESPAPSLIFRGQNQPLDAGPPDDQGLFASDFITGRSGQAYGNLFRIGAITGPGVGRTRPIFPVSTMPYIFADNNLFFGDVRGFKSSADTFGLNLGGGYRRYVPAWDRIFGVNAYYDYDNTSGATFRQMGFGVESLGALYDVRANAYFPTGSSQELLGIVNVDGTQKFVGHNLIVDQQRTLASALHGFDAEIGIPLPGPILQRHDVRVFGGGYWYESNLISSFGGWRTRVQGNVIPSVALNLEVSHDEQFKTNVVFGASWVYGGFKQSDGERKTQYSRMTTPVQRNYNMIVGITKKTDLGTTVINPSTNLPYFIEHVDSNTTGVPVGGIVGNGTVENPFKVFGDAQNTVKHDIIFVHANSVFNGVGVGLEENVRVLGEASTVEHVVSTFQTNSTPGFGNTLLLPHPTAIPTGSTATLGPCLQTVRVTQSLSRITQNSADFGLVTLRI